MVHDKKIEIIYPTEAFKDDLHAFLDMTFEAKRGFYIPIEEFPRVGYIDTFGQHVPERKTFAYFFEEDDHTIYYSGDLGNIQVTLDFLSTQDKDKITVFHDINKKEVSGHVYYKEAMEKLSGYIAYGYHCDKATMPEDNTFPLVEDFPEMNL